MVDKRWRRRKAYQQLLKQQKKEPISSAELHAAASYRLRSSRRSSDGVQKHCGSPERNLICNEE